MVDSQSVVKFYFICNLIVPKSFRSFDVNGVVKVLPQFYT